MATIADIAETQRMAITSLNQRMADFEAHLRASSSGADLNSLHKDFIVFKEHVWNVLNVLQQQMVEVSRNVDIIEMRHRKKFVLLGGVPEKADEKVADIVTSIMQTQLGFNKFESTSLTVCHRLGSATNGRPRIILIRFNDVTIKDAVWRSKTKLKGTSYVLSEFLTRQRQTTFSAARKLFGVSNVWTIDGNISVKLPDGKRRRIHCLEDVEALGLELGKTLDAPPVSQASTKTASQTAPAQVAARPKRNISRK